MPRTVDNTLRDTPPPRARVGRPPAVTVQAIVDAALEIGLDTVTLKEIADRLGVALATLYRHVRNRDELVRLAAFQLTLARRLPDAAHAHWAELALRYAESLYDAFVDEPQLIHELLRGRIGPHAEVDVLEDFLGAVASQGFSAEEGTALFHAIGTLTLGAAAGAIGAQAAQAAGIGWNTAMCRTLAERDADELRQVRHVFPAMIENAPAWRPALQALLTGIAQCRGETLPPGLFGRGRAITITRSKT